MDLRKARCIVLKESDDSIKNLHVESGPTLMIDCPPYTMYFIMSSPRETKVGVMVNDIFILFGQRTKLSSFSKLTDLAPHNHRSGTQQRAIVEGAAIDQRRCASSGRQMHQFHICSW